MNSSVKFSSLHTHSIFCDGSDGIETLCKTAYEKGLCAIGFSSHGPITKKTGFKTEWHIADSRLDEYIGEVRAAKKRWEGKIAVFLGLEIDYIKGLCSAADKDVRSLDLDYIIGSVHYIIPENGAAPFTVDGSLEEVQTGINEAFKGDINAFIDAYWTSMAEMLDLGGFDILGHADLLKKNNKNYCLFNPESRAYADNIEKICAAISNNDCAVECNTGGITRKKIQETYPSLPFLRCLKKYNVPVIITADAHKAQDLDGNYDIAAHTLSQAGYGEHALFEGRAGGKAMWGRGKVMNNE